MEGQIARGKAAWAGLAGELVPVSVEGRRADILACDLGKLEKATAGSSVRLLRPEIRLRAEELAATMGLARVDVTVL